MLVYMCIYLLQLVFIRFLRYQLEEFPYTSIPLMISLNKINYLTLFSKLTL